jgi:hypothetical protein
LKEQSGDYSSAGARWLLAFAKQDFKSATEQEMLAVASELITFLERSAPLGHKKSLGEPRRAEMERCQRWLRRGLKQLSRRPKLSRKEMSRKQFSRKGAPIWMTRARVNFHLSMRAGRLSVMKWAGIGVFPWFKFAALETLMAVRRRVRACQREKCGQLFVAWKRQRYCRPTCGQAVRTRRYQQKHRKRVQAQRQKRYDRAMRAKAGSRVKVGGRSVGSSATP